MSYTDPFNTDPNSFNLGTPTVDSAAVVGNLSNDAGMAAPVTGAAPGMTAPAPGVTGVNGAAPTPPGGGGMFGGNFFGQNGPAQFALGAIQTLGSLWNSFQQNKMAREAMKFQKDAFKTNLANQTQSYNTALEDRIRSRYEGMEGATQADADSYIEKNRL
jgi:hypothetical protein